MPFNRWMVQVTILAVLVLSACSGNNPSMSSVSNAPVASSAPVSVTMGDTPPSGVAILSFKVTVSAADFEPGDVSLLNNPLEIEMTRLESETAFLNTMSVAAGSYTGAKVTFSNPKLTIMNNSASAIGTCAVGQICRIVPTLAQPTVTFTGAPFPLTVSSGSPVGLLMDFNVQSSLDATLTLTPTISFTQLPPLQGTGEFEGLNDVVGKVTAIDTTNSTITIQLAGGQSLTFSVGTNPHMGDFDEEGMANLLSAIAVGQIIEVDLRLMPGGSLVARNIELAEADKEGELDGIVTAVDSPTQFEIVVREEMDDSGVSNDGGKVTVTIGTNAVFHIDHMNLQIPTGLTFASSADLQVGQNVQIHPATEGQGVASTDRIRLRPSSVTARVKAISGNQITVDNLPAIFTSANPSITELVISTSSQTEFEGVSGVGNLSVGDSISAGGLLFKTTGDPTMVAKHVRKR